MSNFLTTLILAAIVVVLAILLMAIGWLITGKNRVVRGCGTDPTKSRDDECGTKSSCSLCENNPHYDEVDKK
ncbi:MAG: hypothetical protein E6Q59_01470 [Nitrosomonas sp.]|nr:MAG: hypothetical protein E6Q59_01470 [Nitrosomonas sp.]